MSKWQRFYDSNPTSATLGGHFLLYIGVIIVLFLAQCFLNDYVLRIFNNILIFIILAVSYNLINGVTGQLSLEPNGFVAIGAYITALMLLDEDSKLGMFDLADPHPFILSMNSELLPALLCSGLVAAFIAILLAFPVFRVRGDYLAIVTLGFGFIIKILAINNPEWTNGAIGLNEIPNNADSVVGGLRNLMQGWIASPSLPEFLKESLAFIYKHSFENGADITVLFWSGILAAAAVILILQVVSSKYGRAMKAVRDDEDAAIAMGINTFKIKTFAFSTSAFLEGVGGGLMAVLLTTIDPKIFGFELTFQLLIIIVLGGLGSTSGAILGAILVIGGGEWLRFLDQPLVFFGTDFGTYPGLRMVFFSLILLIIMLFAREGIMGKKEIWDLKPRFFGIFGRRA
ncbi:branched-chain amino acid ABC transporter permease [Helicobacter canadensis]|uniref:ABC transporter, permease protein n=1 Tax=Helicobacter canadensis MIT 98-5491 TaxID=537970 RepID=C5ZWC1_9HELI|nr:branched-chain amino acid ABC transporter permease [Helicobacter canadensis]EES89439.1 ABC transporter, permease protein [Helicobacter canadensis MIT 98-5491]EFR48229.1 branched-chain amino acid ABC transporter, permease protein [Helicobacter canadensis MIT 98-5491]STO99477.1 leucine/isoleucine/valine transporter permease subunit [Helicobacter canadensis]